MYEEEFDNYNYDDFYHDHSFFNDPADPDNIHLIRTPETDAIENVQAYRPMTIEEEKKVWEMKKAEWNRLYGNKRNSYGLFFNE